MNYHTEIESLITLFWRALPPSPMPSAKLINDYTNLADPKPLIGRTRYGGIFMAEIGRSQQLDSLSRLSEDLLKGNSIDPASASELILDFIQELQTKNDKISALEEELSQKTTDLAKFKAELDMERALMGEVFRQNSAGIVIMDAQSGKATRVNMVAKKIMGRESVISRSVEDHNSGGRFVLFHLDGTPCELEEMPLMRSALYSEIVTNEELIFNRMDGLQGVLNVSSGPIFDCNGEVIAAVATFYDVTRKGNK